MDHRSQPKVDGRKRRRRGILAFVASVLIASVWISLGWPFAPPAHPVGAEVGPLPKVKSKRAIHESERSPALVTRERAQALPNPVREETNDSQVPAGLLNLRPPRVAIVPTADYPFPNRHFPGAENKPDQRIDLYEEEISGHRGPFFVVVQVSSMDPDPSPWLQTFPEVEVCTTGGAPNQGFVATRIGPGKMGPDGIRSVDASFPDRFYRLEIKFPFVLIDDREEERYSRLLLRTELYDQQAEIDLYLHPALGSEDVEWGQHREPWLRYVFSLPDSVPEKAVRVELFERFNRPLEVDELQVQRKTKLRTSAMASAMQPQSIRSYRYIWNYTETPPVDLRLEVEIRFSSLFTHRRTFLPDESVIREWYR